MGVVSAQPAPTLVESAMTAAALAAGFTPRLHCNHGAGGPTPAGATGWLRSPTARASYSTPRPRICRKRGALCLAGTRRQRDVRSRPAETVTMEKTGIGQGRP